MDAKKANLAQKKSLRGLKLVWEKKSGASKLREKVDEEVLEALEPHPNLESLKIEGYNGRCFPVWMSTISTMQNTLRIEIVDCPNCRRLPKLGELPHLKILRLQNLGLEYMMDDEVEVGNEVNVQFPSLEILSLHSLSNLKGLFMEQKMRKSAAFPKLEKLIVNSCCSSLILPPFSSLKHLRVTNCSGVTLASFSELNSLDLLDVRIDNEQMKCFLVEMLEKLTSLKILQISCAQELPVLEQGLRALKSLRDLEIKGKKLSHIPEGWFRHLIALKYLYIRECEELAELPEDVRYLHNLQFLALWNLPKMVGLPKALHHLSSLEQISIMNLRQLNSLPDWLDQLTSLRILVVFYCPELVQLPPCIQGMTNLQAFTVTGCSSELERRCERGKGEYWHLIAHIPQLRIGDGV